MPDTWPRNLVATAIATVALATAIVSILFGSYQTGIHWRIDGSRLVVDQVDGGSRAERDGVEVGMIAVEVNGIGLIDLPATQYGEPSPSSPDGPPTVVGVEPAVPTGTGLQSFQLADLASRPVEGATLITPENLAIGTADSWQLQSYFYPGAFSYGDAPWAVIPGLLALLGGASWLSGGRSGESLRSLAIPLAVATAVPFLVQPLLAIGAFAPVMVAGLLIVAGMVPLAGGLTALIPDRASRSLSTGTMVLLGGVAVAAILNAAVTTNQGPAAGSLRWLALGTIPLLPGLAAAAPTAIHRLRAGTGVPGRLLQSSELAVAGATPLFAVGTDRWPFAWPLILWLLGVFVAARFTVRPLARLATRATLQRDLIVAATEAERARLAADIHDDALQELTLLVRRLEASGDNEGAEIGRTVADRLRAICGDLRLPILDDLGVGPALDWLVLRIERLAGGEVRLERADDARHAPDVELAIFRVAQEALANAVKHGRPPIVVRYRSTPGGISLAIDDAGPGITDQAPADAERAGRFGLLNMAQRAEQIGAILDVKRWPGGGTHVALEWRPR
jgi:signal transduction histidine kinase